MQQKQRPKARSGSRRFDASEIAARNRWLVSLYYNLDVTFLWIEWPWQAHRTQRGPGNVPYFAARMPAMSPSHYGMRWKGIKAGFNERFRLSVGAIRAPIPRRNWYNWRWSIGDRAARFKGRRLRLRQIQSARRSSLRPDPLFSRLWSISPGHFILETGLQQPRSPIWNLNLSSYQFVS